MYLKLSWLYLGMALNSNLKQIVKPGPQTTKAQPHPSPNKFKDPISPKPESMYCGHKFIKMQIQCRNDQLSHVDNTALFHSQSISSILC